MRLLPQSIALALLLAASAVTRTAGAQPVSEAEALTPPRLVHFVEAELEVELDEAKAVLLELVVDRDGKVSQARVVEGAGEPFDAAALAAARGFVFEPARRGTATLAVKLSYRYVFTPALPPSPPAPQPGAPSAGTEPAESAPRPAGDAPQATPGEPSRQSEPAELHYGATAEIEAPRREVTRRSVEAERLRSVAGVRGDAVRAVEILPGVGRSESFEGGAPILRGSAQYESQVFLDGAPLPLLYHFGGLTSIVQSRLLERVELYPGNFSARYGRATGGIVDARLRSPRDDRLHALAELSLLDSSALVEAPIGERGAVAVAARRSNIDLVFESLVPDDAYSVVAAPVYYDYQLITEWQLARDHRLRVMGYGARDSLKLLFSTPEESDPALRGEIEGVLAFHRLGLRLTSRLAPELDQTLDATVGLFTADQTIGRLHQRIEVVELHGRGEWALRLGDAATLYTGIDGFGQLADGSYVGPRPPAMEGDPTADEAIVLQDQVSLTDDSIRVLRPAAYAELALSPHPRVQVVPGVRFDWYGDAGAWTVDPRLSTRAELGARTTLKAGVGLFSQPPEWYQLLPGLGNPELEPYHALHTSLGVERGFGEALSLGIEGFYKWLYHRVVATAGGRPPYFVNDGTGRVVGVELSARVTPDRRSFGYLAYTLSRSQRRDRNEAWRLADIDQTHVLSLVASRDLGAGWSLGGRFRLVSGNPTTPVVAAVYDPRRDQYRPVYGALGSARADTFHQLDLRLEKTWHWRPVSLSAYLEVLNAYNRANAQGYRYSFDYQEREAVSGLPIFPNLGLRGEL